MTHRTRPHTRAALAFALVLGSAGLLGRAAHLTAQDAPDLVTDRPDQTESAESVPAGLFQLEIGWTYALEEGEGGGGEIRSHAVPEALLRIGLGSGLEARVGFAGWISEDEELADGPDRTDSGVGDVEVGLKWRVVRGNGASPQIALLGGVTLPLGQEGFGSERADPTVRLSLSHDLSERVALGYNAGLSWETAVFEAPGSPTREALDTQADFLYTLALGVGLTERLGAFFESYGFLGLSDGRPDRHSLDGGLTLLLSPTLQLDLRSGFGLNEAAEDWLIGAGLSVRFPS